jgi:hypothetical protein
MCTRKNRARESACEWSSEIVLTFFKTVNVFLPRSTSYIRTFHSMSQFVIAVDNSLLNLCCNHANCKKPFADGELRAHVTRLDVSAPPTLSDARSGNPAVDVQQLNAKHSVYHWDCYALECAMFDQAFCDCVVPARSLRPLMSMDIVQAHPVLREMHQSYADYLAARPKIKFVYYPVMQRTVSSHPSVCLTAQFPRQTNIAELDIPVLDFNTQWNATQLGSFLKRIQVGDFEIRDTSLTHSESYREALAWFAIKMKDKVDIAHKCSADTFAQVWMHEVKQSFSGSTVKYSMRYIIVQGLKPAAEQRLYEQFLALNSSSKSSVKLRWSDLDLSEKRVTGATSKFGVLLRERLSVLDAELEALKQAIVALNPLPDALAMESMCADWTWAQPQPFSSVVQTVGAEKCVLEMRLNTQIVEATADYYAVCTQEQSTLAAAAAAAAAAASSTDKDTAGDGYDYNIWRFIGTGVRPGLPNELHDFSKDLDEIRYAGTGDMKVVTEQESKPMMVKRFV